MPEPANHGTRSTVRVPDDVHRTCNCHGSRGFDRCEPRFRSDRPKRQHGRTVKLALPRQTSSPALRFFRARLVRGALAPDTLFGRRFFRRGCHAHIVHKIGIAPPRAFCAALGCRFLRRREMFGSLARTFTGVRLFPGCASELCHAMSTRGTAKGCVSRRAVRTSSSPRAAFPR